MKNIPYSKEQLMRANMKLMEQNKRYREALHFYATCSQGIGETKHGEVAREALKNDER